MAVLPTNERVNVSREVQIDCSDTREVLSGITKADLQAAINAADDWVNANVASYNTAIPQPARNNLTAAQKAKILMYVVRKRYVTGV